MHTSDRPATSLFQQIVVYTVVIFALWNIPAVRNVINPLKLFAIGWHELCHIIVVSVVHPGAYCRNAPFLNTFVVFVGYPDWRNDTASLYRPERWRVHQSRRRLPTSHSFCGLYRVRVLRCSLRPGGLRHPHIKNNELGPRFWHDHPISSRQRQAVRPSRILASKFSTFSYSTIVLTVLYEGLLIGFWFIDHA